MEFLKRHYEKLILLALSVISFLAVWNMSGVMNKTKDVQDSDLEIRIPPADQVSLIQKEKKYQELVAKLSSASTAKEDVEKLKKEKEGLDKDKDFIYYYVDTKKFSPSFMIGKTQLEWERKAGAKADLVDIYPMLRCPHCHYGIPLDWFTKEGGSKCRICGGELRTPPPMDKIKRRLKRTPNDRDGDGISNEQETANGLNPQDPGDALLDYDRDGFSNRYEINTSNTGARSANERPPLWRRLRFKGMRKVELPIQITQVDVNSPDRKNWEASIKMEVRDPRTGRVSTPTKYCHIGGKIDFDGRRYVVTDIKRTIEKDKNGVDQKKDSVTLKMEARNDKEKALVHELKLVMGEKVYSPDYRVVLEDIGVPVDPSAEDDPNLPADKQEKRFYTLKKGREKKKAIFELRVGEVFEMGAVDDSPEGKNVGKESYVLTSFDEKAQVAQLSRVKTRNNTEEDLTKDIKGDLMLVTEKSGIPEVDWVAQPTKKSEDEKANDAKTQKR